MSVRWSLDICRECWLGKFPSLHNRKEGNPLPVNGTHASYSPESAR